MHQTRNFVGSLDIFELHYCEKHQLFEWSGVELVSEDRDQANVTIYDVEEACAWINQLPDLTEKVLEYDDDGGWFR